jgi:hypothetical protein
MVFLLGFLSFSEIQEPCSHPLKRTSMRNTHVISLDTMGMIAYSLSAIIHFAYVF